MPSFVLEVLLPDKTLFWGKAGSVTVKAVDGEVQILAGHAPYVNILAAGEVRLTTDEETTLKFPYSGGIIEVAKDKTSVLVYPQ